ncbi:hypothetical protein [Propionivibrio sp.]|uniref:hypothetical protein n=1 Tax=Propionivibrio sp. TaxID=2212460 RepID=UPI003BF1CE24
MTTSHCAPERCFAAILALYATPPTVPLDLARIARHWPRPLAMRLLSGLPTDCAVASLLVLPSRLETARVGQLLRAMALDGAADSAVSRTLRALAQVNFARAATLRRDMEWEAQDAAFFPAERVLPGDELPLHLALLADALWDDLPLPCFYRLPAPKDHPDTWPEPAAASVPIELPEAIVTGTATHALRAGLEWLHLWRLDAALAELVWQSVPAGQAQGWIEALQEVTRPDSSEALPYDMVVLEHVMDEHESFLSQLEVDALLRPLCDSPDTDAPQRYTEDVRSLIQGAVQAWLKRAGRG